MVFYELSLISYTKISPWVALRTRTVYGVWPLVMWNTKRPNSAIFCKNIEVFMNIWEFEGFIFIGSSQINGNIESDLHKTQIRTFISLILFHHLYLVITFMAFRIQLVFTVYSFIIKLAFSFMSPQLFLFVPLKSIFPFLIKIIVQV